MEYIIFKKSKLYGFSLKEKSIGNIGKLAYFLTDDCGSGGSSFIEWANDPNQYETESNYSFLEKDGDNVLIGFLYDSDEDMYKNAFSINKDEFIKTIEKWIELNKQKPNEIYITYKNGKITIEGKNLD